MIVAPAVQIATDDREHVGAHAHFYDRPRKSDRFDTGQAVYPRAVAELTGCIVTHAAQQEVAARDAGTERAQSDRRRAGEVRRRQGFGDETLAHGSVHRELAVHVLAPAAHAIAAVADAHVVGPHREDAVRRAAIARGDHRGRRTEREGHDVLARVAV